MKLVSFTVQNFRCYQVPFKVNVDSFIAIMGKNDIGKSALFEALSIFFEQSKMDQNDASVGGDSQYGSGNKRIRAFRDKFLKHLMNVRAVYHEANIEEVHSKKGVNISGEKIK